jgi:ABC-type branched-subunit amino acid transport system substrate-binding protein
VENIRRRSGADRQRRSRHKGGPKKVTDGGATPTREAVRDAIQLVKVDTLQGPISFDANGDLEDKTISVFQLRQDKSIPAGDPRQYHYIGVAPAT